jgi:hypothetical protein
MTQKTRICKGPWCKGNGDGTILPETAFGKHAWCRECNNRNARENQAWASIKINGQPFTREHFDRAVHQQDGKCKICDCTKPVDAKDERGLVPDHDHDTLEFRAILCARCNIGIGHLCEDPVLLRKAADYIEQFRSSPAAQRQ